MADTAQDIVPPFVVLVGHVALVAVALAADDAALALPHPEMDGLVGVE